MAATKKSATKQTAKQAPAKRPATKRAAIEIRSGSGEEGAGPQGGRAGGEGDRYDSRPRRRQRARHRRRRPSRATASRRPRGTTKDGIAYTKDFDVKFLKVQHDLLIAEREALLGQANRLEDEANSLIEDGEMGDVQFDDESGEGDTMVVERERDLALSAQARQTIADIDAALAADDRGHLRLLASCRADRSRASGSRRSRGRPCSSRRRSEGSARADDGSASPHETAMVRRSRVNWRPARSRAAADRRRGGDHRPADEALGAQRARRR